MIGSVCLFGSPSASGRDEALDFDFTSLFPFRRLRVRLDACAIRPEIMVPSKHQAFREFQVVVLGAGGVGKSCLTAQFVHNEWIESYDPTIEDSYQKQLTVDGRQVVLEILDTAGTEQFTSMRDVYMRNGQGFLLVFSITSRSSLAELYGLREEILRIKDQPQVPIVIIGNKSDLEDQREVPRPKAFAVSQEWGAPYYEASARTRTNVDEVFTDICRQMLMADDAMEALDEETYETRYKYDDRSRRRRRRKRKDHPKCVIL